MSKTPRKNILPIAFLLGGAMLLKYAAARRWNAVGKVGHIYRNLQLLYETPSPYEFFEELPASPEFNDFAYNHQKTKIDVYQFPMSPGRLKVFSDLLGTEVREIGMTGHAVRHAIRKHSKDPDPRSKTTVQEVERIEALLQYGDIILHHFKQEKNEEGKLGVEMKFRDRRRWGVACYLKYLPEIKALRAATFFISKIDD